MTILEKLLLRLELASIQVQSSAVIPWCTRMLPDVLGLKLGLVNLMGACFATLTFRRFKQYFSRGCQASFAFSDFSAYPPLPPSQTAAAEVLLFVLYMPTTHFNKHDSKRHGVNM